MQPVGEAVETGSLPRPAHRTLHTRRIGKERLRPTAASWLAFLGPGEAQALICRAVAPLCGSPVLSGIDVVTGMLEVHAEMLCPAQATSMLHPGSHDLPRVPDSDPGAAAPGTCTRGREKHLRAPTQKVIPPLWSVRSSGPTTTAPQQHTRLRRAHDLPGHPPLTLAVQVPAQDDVQGRDPENQFTSIRI